MATSNMFGSNSSGAHLIQQTLGDAYHSVKMVADHLDAVITVAANAPAVQAAANNLNENTEIITGQTGQTGVSIPLPAEIQQTDVLNSVVMLTGTDGALYAESSGHFSTKILAGQLVLAIDAGAPAALQGADVQWTLTYKK